MNKVLITGATSGIGLETAVLLASRGYLVYAIGCKKEKLEALKAYGIKTYVMDLADEASIDSVSKEILEETQGIDILINNAGYGVFGPIETTSMEEAKRQFEVNVFGLTKLTGYFLPHMRRNRKGKIINLSSIAGKAVFFMGGWYHASKYALEAISDALRMELAPFGIEVILIEPGAIKTNWGLIAAKHLKESSIGSVYEKMAKGQVARLEKNYKKSPFLTPPKIVAETILNAILAEKPKTRYLVGFGARAVLILKRLLPDRAFDWLMTRGIKK